MADNSRIVVLEGPLSRGMADVLVESGYPVTRAADASQVLPEAEGAALVVLDVLAPGMDLEGLSELEWRVEAPVLVIVPGLDTGHQVTAIQAPFEQDTLLAQVQELLAQAPPPLDVVTVGELVIDLAGWRVMLRGRRVRLSPTEFCFLAQLAHKPGGTVKYDELLEAVWECSPEFGDPRLITSCVYRLRRKLGDDAAHPAYIVNVPGVGYRLRSQQQWEAAIEREGQ